MNGEDVLEYLRRRDKWYLGGGKAALWAPEFPLWLDQPGFWDHAVYLDYKVGPLFTLAILDEKGNELPTRFLDRDWQPDHATQRYTVGDLKMTEWRSLSRDDVLSASYLFENPTDTPRTLNLIVWTAQEEHERYYGGRVHADLVEHQAFWGLQFMRVIVDQEYRKKQIEAGVSDIRDLDTGLMINIGLVIVVTDTTSFATVRSQRQPNYPRWNYSPFYELFKQHGLQLPNTNTTNADVLDPDAPWLIYGGLHSTITVPAHGAKWFGANAAIADDLKWAREMTEAPEYVLTDEKGDIAPSELTISRQVWEDYFESEPSFECSDPYLQKYYWYRYFGLRLNMVRADNPDIGLKYPCIFEGVNFGWFRQHITYSAFCHMREMRWAHDPAVAQGSLLNFVGAQLPNGAFPGVIKNIIDGDKTLTSNVAFYHADWGRSVRDLHALHPDTDFLGKIYDSLSRYARYFDAERDPEGCGLYDIINHMETGQEYSSRYLFVNPDADKTIPIRLKGVDVTVYIYNLQRALAWMAGELGKDDGAAWDAAADKTKAAILTHMWDADTQFFYDCAPDTLQRSTVKAATGFYPFLADIAGAEHAGAFAHLFNPAEFGTPYPVPSLSADDPYYSAEGEWKGTRLVCPWNGRAWLMTNSHVADALCQTAQNVSADLTQNAVDFLRRFVTMLFTDGDVERPTSYEYYNPITGQAPYFRGTDDYMHSWISDLILRYVAGIQPQANGHLRVAPLPFDLDYFTVERLKIRGHDVRVTWRKDEHATARKGLTVYVDGVERATSPTLAEFDITLEG